MLESSTTCPAPNYSHIVHTPEGSTSVAPQLNYISDIVLELKAELAKIKTEVKEVKKQLSVIHLSLINEVRHSGKSDLGISTPFQHKYPFQNLKNKNPFPLQDIKIEKEVYQSSPNPEKEQEDGRNSRQARSII